LVSLANQLIKEWKSMPELSTGMTLTRAQN